jgi:hypothetical protein
MRFLIRGLVAALAMLTTAGPASAYDILATVFQFFPPGEGDTHPTLDGLIKIDSVTGVASPFIPENLAMGFGYLSDVAIGPHDGMIYVSSQVGTIMRFAPNGSPLGLYGFFGSPEAPDGVGALEFAPDGTLYVATGSGRIAVIDPTGTPQADVATGLTFPSGLALSPGGDLYVSVGQVGGDGEILRIVPGDEPVTVVGPGFIGGGSGPTFLPAKGDYNGDNANDADDYTAWQSAYGSNDASADGNGDGVVDAADYTVWRDNEGATAKLLIADLAQDPSGNEIVVHDLVANTTGTLTTIPVALPDPLPPGGVPTNVPSEVLVTPQGTILVSTLGPSQRPFNNAAVLEFDVNGDLLNTIQTNLPPLSGIAILPSVGVAAVPEPAALSLVALAIGALARRRR